MKTQRWGAGFPIPLWDAFAVPESATQKEVNLETLSRVSFGVPSTASAARVAPRSFLLAGLAAGHSGERRARTLPLFGQPHKEPEQVLILPPGPAFC